MTNEQLDDFTFDARDLNTMFGLPQEHELAAYRLNAQIQAIAHQFPDVTVTTHSKTVINDDLAAAVDAMKDMGEVEIALDIEQDLVRRRREAREQSVIFIQASTNDAQRLEELTARIHETIPPHGAIEDALGESQSPDLFHIPGLERFYNVMEIVLTDPVDQSDE